MKCSRMFAHVFAVFLDQRAQVESLSQKLMARLYVFEESEGMCNFVNFFATMLEALNSNVLILKT